MAKILSGIVVSTKMQKTVVIKVETKYRHHLYKKVITRHKKFKAHNELEGIQEGDVVTFTETRPISKDTHFKVLEKVTQ